MISRRKDTSLFGWSAATPEERCVAVHEAGHAVVAEVFEWRVGAVTITRGRPGEWPPPGVSGSVGFPRRAPSPLADIAASLAGHAADILRRGVADISPPDRRQARAAFRRGGVEVKTSDLIEIEGRLADDLGSVPGFASMCRRIADAVLGPDGHLSRREFRRVAGPRLQDLTFRRAVRRVCRKAINFVIDEVCGMGD